MGLFILFFIIQTKHSEIRLADSLFENEQYQRAFALYAKHLQSCSEIDSAWIFKGLGNIAFVQGDFTSAQEHYRLALEIFKTFDELRGRIKVLNNLGQIHIALHEPDKALTLYEKAIRMGDQIIEPTHNDSVDRITLLGNTGQALQAMPQVQRSREMYHHAILIAQAIRFSKGIADNMFNCAGLFQMLGDVDSALVYYTTACSLYNNDNLLKSQADCYRETGNIYRKIGDYTAAIQCLNNALEVFASYYTATGKILLGHAESLNNLGLVYMEIGELSQARTCFVDAQQHFQTIGDIKGIAITLQNRAAVYMEYATYDSVYYDSAQSMYDIAEKHAKDQSARAFLLNNQGVLYQYRGQYSQADKAFTQALDLLQEEDKLNRIKVLNNKGNCAFSQQKYQLALTWYTDAYSEAIIKSHKTWEAALLSNIGMTQHALGKSDEAIKSLTRAAFIIEDIRHMIISQEYRSQYFEDKITIYEKLIQIMYEKGDVKQAFLYAEKAKARAFLDLLSDVDFSEQHDISPDIRMLIKQEQHLVRKIEYLHGDSLQSQAIKKLRHVDEQLQQAYPEYYHLKSIEPVGVKDIQSILDDSTAVLEYFFGSYRGHVYAITDRSISVHELSGHPETIYTAVDSLVRIIRRRKNYTEYGTWLYDQLIRPVRSSLTSIKRLCIIPHGILHHLPFSTLIDDNGHALIDQFDIFYAPSASIYTIVHNRNQLRKQGVAIFAKSDFNDHPEWQDLPLPGTQAEKDSLLSRSGFSSVRVYADTEGPAFKPTEANLKAIAQDFDIIHCATHGKLINDSPMDSKIILSADDEEDGNLTVREIFTMELDAYLVTLSACETGNVRGFNEQGRYSAGDDLTGLTRAFLFAGASSVVASLWKVHDLSTALLMTRFYRNLATMDKVKAMCEAQRWLFHNDELYYFNKPFFWAPFVVFGDWQ